MVGCKDYHYHFHYPGWLFRVGGEMGAGSTKLNHSTKPQQFPLSRGFPPPNRSLPLLDMSYAAGFGQWLVVYSRNVTRTWQTDWVVVAGRHDSSAELPASAPSFRFPKRTRLPGLAPSKPANQNFAEVKRWWWKGSSVDWDILVRYMAKIKPP